MPTSVLLAVLAAAGLLALAPALVRRYDATERLVAERAQSTARVLQRRRRRRTVPGRRPVNPPRSLVVTLSAGSPHRGAERAGLRAARAAAAPAGCAPCRPPRARPAAGRRPAGRTPRAVYRRRRVLAALLLLNVVELVGVVVVGPGFWIGFAVTGTLLVVYVVHLRNRALADRRAAARARPGRRPGWPPGRPRCAGSRPAGPRPAGRRSAGWPPSARRYAVPRWAWTGPADLPAAASGGSVSYRRPAGCAAAPYESGRGSAPA